MSLIDADEACRIVGAKLKSDGSKPCLIAIDGLPLSGESTLAQRIAEEFGLGIFPFDDFCAAQETWRDAAPAFPFPHFRNEMFVASLRLLAERGQCVYCPIDWSTMTVSSAEVLVRLTGPVIVEGVSVLRAELRPLYALRFWVESDRATVFDAMLARDGARLAEAWKRIFLPSVDLYVETKPSQRADFIVRGRGFSH